MILFSGVRFLKQFYVLFLHMFQKTLFYPQVCVFVMACSPPPPALANQLPVLLHGGTPPPLNSPLKEKIPQYETDVFVNYSDGAFLFDTNLLKVTRLYTISAPHSKHPRSELENISLNRIFTESLTCSSPRSYNLSASKIILLNSQILFIASIQAVHDTLNSIILLNSIRMIALISFSTILNLILLSYSKFTIITNFTSIKIKEYCKSDFIDHMNNFLSRWY